jgi:hypothetical protein
MRLLTVVTLLFGLLLLAAPASAAACWLNVTDFNRGSPYRAGSDDTFLSYRNGVGTTLNSGHYLYVWVSTGSSTNTFDEIDRSIIIFDTSLLPDAASIDAATMTIEAIDDPYPDDLYPDGINVSLSEGTVGDENNIVASDYQGAINTQISDTSTVTDSDYGPLVFTFNGKTGYTVVFMRLKDDVDGLFTGVWTPSSTGDVGISSSSPIYLNISYTSGACGASPTPTPTLTPTPTPTPYPVDIVGHADPSGKPAITIAPGLAGPYGPLDGPVHVAWKYGGIYYSVLSGTWSTPEEVYVDYGNIELGGVSVNRTVLEGTPGTYIATYTETGHGVGYVVNGLTWENVSLSNHGTSTNFGSQWRVISSDGDSVSMIYDDYTEGEHPIVKWWHQSIGGATTTQTIGDASSYSTLAGGLFTPYDLYVQNESGTYEYTCSGVGCSGTLVTTNTSAPYYDSVGSYNEGVKGIYTSGGVYIDNGSGWQYIAVPFLGPWDFALDAYGYPWFATISDGYVEYFYYNSTGWHYKGTLNQLWSDEYYSHPSIAAGDPVYIAYVDPSANLTVMTIQNPNAPTTTPTPTPTPTPTCCAFSQSEPWVPSGTALNFSMGNFTLDTGEYTKYWLYNFTHYGNLSMTDFGYGLMLPLINVFGMWIFLFIYLTYLGMVWIRSGDVTLPLVIGMISAGIWGVVIPQQAFIVIGSMFAICMAVIILKVFRD